VDIAYRRGVAEGVGVALDDDDDDDDDFRG